ncbi:hypothetical protein FCV25MIE_19592 [Fagus crenata]
MSGALSSSRRLQLVVRLPSRSSAREASSEEILKSEHRGQPPPNIQTPKKIWIDAHLTGSLILTVEPEARVGNVRRTLNYSTTVESRAEDNARIISKLRREIDDLRREAQDRSTIKERLRNRVESASTHGETTSLIPRPSFSDGSE